MIPNINGKNSLDKRIWLEKEFFSSANPANEIAGIPIKNENLAASSLFQSQSNAVVRVMPDRDTPGISARI